jgi:hypothetical protein
MQGMEMSSLLDGAGEKGGGSPGGGGGRRSPWGGISKRSRGGSGSMSQSLLGGGGGGGGGAQDFERASASATAQVHPCVVCCTIFSAASAFCLLLLGIYVFADSNGDFIVLNDHKNATELALRSSKGGHIIGAAVLYSVLTAACAYRWHMKIREGVFMRLND